MSDDLDTLDSSNFHPCGCMSIKILWTFSNAMSLSVNQMLKQETASPATEMLHSLSVSHECSADFPQL